MQVDTPVVSTIQLRRAEPPAVLPGQEMAEAQGLLPYKD